MKHLTRQCDEAIYSSGLLDFYFKDLRMGVLDIETTGLNPSRNKFILGGLFDFTEKTLHQSFAKTRHEEKDALAHFLALLAPLDMVVTYNGRHFDLPFIERRMQSFGLTDRLPYNLDLYLVLNGHSPIKRFVPNLKQKTVENYMGLWQSRADEISGAESVELYNTYEKTSDQRLEEKILLHNSDDVLQLTRLLQVVSKCDFHKAMFHLGFPAGPLTVEKIKLEKHFLMISGRQRRTDLDYLGFAFGDYPAETRFERQNASFYMRLPLLWDSGLTIVDLDAAGLNRMPFEIYPTYSSGFLALESPDGRNYMEINHFVKSFIELFMHSI